MILDFEGYMTPEEARISSALVWTANRLNKMRGFHEINRKSKQKNPGIKRWRSRYSFANLGFEGPFQRRELVVDTKRGEIYESIVRLNLDMERGFAEETLRGEFFYVDRESASRRGRVEDHLALIGGALNQLTIHTQCLRSREMQAIR